MSTIKSPSRATKAHDDDERLYEDAREGEDDMGSMSLTLQLPNYKHRMEQPSNDKEELEFLRIENVLLRKKVKELERLRGEKRSMKVDEKEVERIDELLKKAEQAKAEALDYVANSSRTKLGQEVRVLQAILKKDKAERQMFKKKIKDTEEQLRLERQTNEQNEIRFQVDREIFAKILQNDRDAYKEEVQVLVQKMTDLQKEKYEMFLWTKQQQETHLHEIRKLTRALSRTTKMADEQQTQSLAVIDQIHDVRALVNASSA